MRLILTLSLSLVLTTLLCRAVAPEKELRLADFEDEPVSHQSETGAAGAWTWWLPSGADQYVLPISAGVVVDPLRAETMAWLADGAPWPLVELPVFGARFGEETLVVIVPWPHNAQLVVRERQIGVRFSVPEGHPRRQPCRIVTMRRGGDPLAVARAFREWRQNAAETGAIPRPRPLREKVEDLETTARLFGAPHFYLWGPSLFSRHDLARTKWIPFARALRDAPASSFGGRLLYSFTAEQNDALRELAEAKWPMDHLTVTVAGAIDHALTKRELLAVSPDVSPAEVIRENRAKLAEEFGNFVGSPKEWGDGLSRPLLDAFHDAGIERALLLLSDLYGTSFRPDVVARAEELGFLLGPYDSYHSVHSPNAGPNETWETAQFGQAAYEHGRVINADGSGHRGFRGRGYHFSPEAAWPYVQKRVGRIVAQAPYSTWFIDCDATAECFDDFSPEHPATKWEDTKWRRQRLAWLEANRRMVVGSEGGSALFADVIHYGHGVETPYLGHLDPAFRDRESPHFLGRHWPPDSPEQAFKPIPVPPSLKTPYFDPAVRIPLYQAALGDEVIATHHWSFDSLKFEDVAAVRELMEILYQVPPMYHLNREMWPKRRARILRHLSFWSPLHRSLATVPLTNFEWLTEDRLVQQTTFEAEGGPVTITVNFSEEARAGHPPRSASIGGGSPLAGRVFRVE